MFAPDDEIIFRASERGANFVYRVKEDGTGQRNVVPTPVLALHSVSPDGRWVVAYAPVSGEDVAVAVLAYPTIVRCLGRRPVSDDQTGCDPATPLTADRRCAQLGRRAAAPLAGTVDQSRQKHESRRDTSAIAWTAVAMAGLIHWPSVNHSESPAPRWPRCVYGWPRFQGGVSWTALHGAAGLGGIGFTMSLFIATLAFDGTTLLDAAKVGILSGSIAAGIVGALVVRRGIRSA